MQVWCNDEIVGEFLVDIGDQKEYRLAVMQDDLDISSPAGSLDAAVSCNVLTLRVKKRYCSVSDHSLRLGDPNHIDYVRTIHDIPNYAEKHYNVESQETRFSWPCIEVSVEDYEVLFDQTCFVPV